MILDETDRALLRLLQQDADQSAAALAKNLEMSQPAICLLYTSPSPRDLSTSRMPSSA